MKVTAEAFITAWQSSTGYEEVAQKMGINVRAVRNRGHYYRKKGIPLVSFKTGPRNNWQSLAKLAESFVNRKKD